MNKPRLTQAGRARAWLTSNTKTRGDRANAPATDERSHGKRLRRAARLKALR